MPPELLQHARDPVSPQSDLQAVQSDHYTRHQQLDEARLLGGE
jgi:hypothetical protein